MKSHDCIPHISLISRSDMNLSPAHGNSLDSSAHCLASGEVLSWLTWVHPIHVSSLLIKLFTFQNISTILAWQSSCSLILFLKLFLIRASLCHWTSRKGMLSVWEYAEWMHLLFQPSWKSHLSQTCCLDCVWTLPPELGQQDLGLSSMLSHFPFIQ